MKTLFAVSNENVSNKIVDSYRKKYGNTLSFKNVFYFNAIIKEIQRDKTYDRIVISEDLEPFSNSNYDVMDKFILERLQEVSINAINQEGRNIDIIIICTDRRTKSSYALARMYEMGIYNALVGSDRRIDNVCNLLEEPRTSDEAREYYKIEDTSSENASVDDVTEQEVQNILIHYKKLGKNEDRYADSFNNIAAQYTDKQLRIIIKCLPINVRAVLESECPKYQELVTSEDETEQEKIKKEKIQEQRKLEKLESEKRLKNRIEREKRLAEREAQRPAQQSNSGIDLIDNKRKEARMTGNVVIPSNMDIRNERKLYSDEELSNIANTPREERNIPNNQTIENNIVPEIKEEPTNPNVAAGTWSGADDFSLATESTQVMQQPAQPAESTLPGLDDYVQPQQPAQPVQSTQPVGSTLPGLDDYVQPQQPVQPVQPTQPAGSTLPGLDDYVQPQQPAQQVQPTQPVESTLPGLDNYVQPQQPVQQVQPTQPVESTLPGFDNYAQQQQPVQQNQQQEQIEQPKPVVQPNQQPMVQEEKSLQTVENNEENSNINSENDEEQNTKRGRGRPRKYPIEPPKPKGKRGRPRKNPLPEEANETENLEENTENLETENNQEKSAEQVQQPTQSVESTLPGLDNYVQPQQPVQPVQSTQPVESTLPGLDDYVQPQQPVQPVQPTQPVGSTLPGLDDYVQPQQPVQPVQQPTQPAGSTLPGLDDYVQPQQPVQPVQQPAQSAESTLPGLDETFENISSTINSPLVNSFTEIDNNSVGNNNVTAEKPEAQSFTEMDSFSESQGAEDLNDSQDFEMNIPGIDDSTELNENYTNNNPMSSLDIGDSLEDKIQESPVDNLVEDFVEMSENMNTTYPKEDFSTSEMQDNNMNNSFAPLPEIGLEQENASAYSPSQDKKETIQKLEENKVYQTGSLDAVLTKDKKVVSFVGASKNGTSFLVNNLACLFSSIGVKTAILDMTKNKNSYYIYTNNDEKLRNIAYTSIEKLEKGIAEGIKVDRNLDVYTALPNDTKNYSNSEAILSTLVQNASLVLIDCDFDTDPGYFANSQEIYLVQSMDILTIQPLTAFLRELKTKGILDQEKLRVVINKEIKVKGLSSKAVIGGAAFYNDPSMSYMTELFNKDKIKACTIPFDETVYSRYLEAMLNCIVSINGYPKNFMNSLKILGNMVYPLLSKQTYNPQQSPEATYGNNNFSSQTNDTLNQMKNKF